MEPHVFLLVLASALVILIGPPDGDAWIWIILSVITHLFYYFAIMNQYRLGDLSHVYPISRGVAPLLVYLIAYVGAGESLTNLGFLAVVVISLGILVLARRSREELRAAWRLIGAKSVLGDLLKESMGPRRIVASVAVTVGIVILQLAGAASVITAGSSLE